MRDGIEGGGLRQMPTQFPGSKDRACRQGGAHFLHGAGETVMRADIGGCAVSWSLDGSGGNERHGTDGSEQQYMGRRMLLTASLVRC